MKTRLFGLFVAITFVGCTSSPTRTVGSTGTAGTTGNGGTTGAAGSPSGAAGDTSGGGTTGAAGSTSGAAGSTTGAAGVTGAAGSTSGAAGSTAGTTGAAGSTTGAAGAATDGGSNTDAIVAVDGPNQTPAGYTGKPLGGTPQTIPGTIQIEDYDTGGEGVAYHDNSVTGHGQLCGVTRTDLIDLNCTGQNGSPKDQTEGTCAALTGDEYLGYIDTGDWLNYTVTVLEAGTYVISTHAGVSGTNTKLMFAFTPTVTTAALPLMGTSGCGVESYHVWTVQNNVGTIALQPGTYVMKLTFVGAGLNLDWVAFTKM